MPPVTPRKLKSCLSSSSPSDCSSPTTSTLSTTATPRTPLTTGSSSCYSTPTRRYKKSVRFKAAGELEQVQTFTTTVSVVTTTKKEEIVREVKKGRKRKEPREDSYYYSEETTVSKIIESGPQGLGITVNSSYGPPTKAPPSAPLPRPTKKERTKYSQSPPSKSSEMKMTYSFDDSTSTSAYPDRSFGQAPPPPIPTHNSSFTEMANYPPVPQIMSSGWSFSEQPDESWWAYNEPQQPPCVAASSRPLRRKRSFETSRQSDSRQPPPAPEFVDIASMRSRRGSSKSLSSSSSNLPVDYVYKEPKESSSRRKREEEDWAETFRLENLKRQARQKTRDREIRKHPRTDVYGSFGQDAGSGYFDKGPAYSFNADEGYDNYF